MPVLRPKEGHDFIAGPGGVVQVTEAEAADLIDQGYAFASPDQIQEYNHAEEFGTTGQQALGLAEGVVRAGTFGLVDQLAEGGVERSKELTLQSPGLQLGAEVLGSVAGGAGVGLGAKAGAKALGAGIQAAGRIGLAAGEIAEAGADEVSEAYKAQRDFNMTNFGLNAAASGLLGGVVSQVGKRVVSPGAAKARRALDRSMTDAEGAVEDAALRAIAPEAITQQAKEALNMAPGNARTKAINNSYDTITSEGAKSLGKTVPGAFTQAYKVLDRSADSGARKRIEKLLPDETPELRTAQLNALLAERDAMAEVLEWAKVNKIDKEASFKGEFKRLQQTHDTYSKQLQKGDTADWFLAARKSKQARQTLHKKLSNKRDAEKFQSGTLDSVKEKLDATEKATRNMLEDEGLFGRAGKWEAETNDIWHRGLKMNSLIDREIYTNVGQLYNAAPGRGTRDMRIDRGKLQRMLRKDENESLWIREALESQAEMLDRAAKLNGPEGTGFSSKAEVDQMRAGAAEIRKVMRDSADANLAKYTVNSSPELKVSLQAEDAATFKAAKEAAGVATGDSGASTGVIAGIALDAVGGSFGVGYVGSQVLRHLMNSPKAKTRIKAAVGQALGVTERVAASSVPGRLAFTAGVQSGIGRFQGDHASPQASYEAKRNAIVAAAENPEEATLAAVESVQSLSDEDPEAFQYVMDKTFSMMSYIKENLPVGFGTSAEYPNGMPLSNSQIRKAATLYDTVTQPMSVLEDMSSRLATPQQMKVLQDVHPEIFQEITQSVIDQVSENPSAVSPTSKAYLSSILGIGEVFGPLYNSSMTFALEEARKSNKESQPASAGVDSQETSAPTASGIKSIQTSVTNA